MRNQYVGASHVCTNDPHEVLDVHCRIDDCKPGTEVPQLAVKSTPQEWADSGRSLFENKRYLQAMHCFERAVLPREMAVANAYYLRECARNILSDSGGRANAFRIAAEAFLGSAMASTNMKLRYFLIAGDCFERGSDDRQAAKAYFDGEDYTKAAQLYSKNGMFDQAVEVIRVHRDRMDQSTVEQVNRVAGLFYFKEQRLEYVIFGSFIHN
jgi:hypothetical protein